MARLIQLTSYAKDSTVYASASVQLIHADSIKMADNASLGQKKAFPSASNNINSVVYVNTGTNNEGQDHVYFVGETLATLITESA